MFLHSRNHQRQSNNGRPQGSRPTIHMCIVGRDPCGRPLGSTRLLCLWNVDAGEEATRDNESLNLSGTLEDIENLGVTKPFVEELSRL